MSQPNSELNIDPNGITLFAQTNFRNQQRRFGIKLDDRRRHMYVLGKTGMGKTTLLENMILSDIYAGHGCAYIDPHGDTAEKILDFIPSWRINDVVYFNPADLDFPIGFNILETIGDEQKHLVGSGLMGVFKKIWPDVWSPRMEYILLNCVLALLDFPGATLLGINRLLVDKDYRQRVIEKIRDPIVKTFWVAEFSSWSEKYATEAVAPVQNKVGQFLSASVIRNILAQVKSTINPRRIMDDRKIFIVNLSKGRIGEDNMRLLGGLIITKLQLAAMERVDMPEADRKDFFLYVDEFQNFATPSFANILSEARKYRLALILAHQYIEQLDETVRDAVFGNIGSILTFRVGSPDALYMEKEFAPAFIPEDLTSLPKYGIYLKLMVDGVSTEPFSASTLPPIAQRTASMEKVIAVSRERYAMPRQEIEDKVLKWSGMESGSSASASPTFLVNGEDPDKEQGEDGAKTALQYPKIESEEELEAKREHEGEENDQEHGGPAEYLRFSPDRLAAIQKSQPAKKKEKPKFKHTCSRCGAVWEMPIQLDPTRPMYCSECLPLIRDEQKVKGKVMKAAVSGRPPEGVELEEAPPDPSQAHVKSDSLAAAMRAIEEGGSVAIRKKATPPEPNRPRIVVEDPSRFAEIAEKEDESDEEVSPLLSDIAEQRGVAVDTRRSVANPPKTLSPAASMPRPATLTPSPPSGDVGTRQEGENQPERQTMEHRETEEERHKRKRKHRDRPRPEEKRRDSLERHFAHVDREDARATLPTPISSARPVMATPGSVSPRPSSLSAAIPPRSMAPSPTSASSVPRSVPPAPPVVPSRPPTPPAPRPAPVLPPKHPAAAPPSIRIIPPERHALDNSVSAGDDKEDTPSGSATVFRGQRPVSPPPVPNRPTLIKGGMRVQPGQRITFDS